MQYTKFLTARMLATKICQEDFVELFQMFSDNEFIKSFGVALSEERVRNTLARDEEQWKKHGFGCWAFRDKNTSEFIGRAGLTKMEIDNQEEVELGYSLVPKFWRQGYGFEMANLSLDIGFNKLGLDNIVCFTLPTNIASRKLMEKLRFIYEKDIIHIGLPHVFYRLKRDQFCNKL